MGAVGAALTGRSPPHGSVSASEPGIPAVLLPRDALSPPTGHWHNPLPCSRLPVLLPALPTTKIPAPEAPGPSLHVPFHPAKLSIPPHPNSCHNHSTPRRFLEVLQRSQLRH